MTDGCRSLGDRIWIVFRIVFGVFLVSAFMAGRLRIALAAPVPIDMAAACAWAYPGAASGQTQGSVYDIVCLGKDGTTVLGGFPDGSGHSLNDRCAYLSHLPGDPLQAKYDAALKGWECTDVGG